MRKNVGSTDRAIRVVLGLGLLSLLYFVDGNLRWIGLVGIVPLFTAFVSWCPLYTLIGVQTCGMSGASGRSA